MKSVTKILFIGLVFLGSITFPQKSFSQAASFLSTGAVSAIVFQSEVACLNVQSGITVLNGQRGAGLFNPNCNLNINFNTLGVQLFPNPVLINTQLKITKKPTINEDFNMSIWNAEGGLVTSLKMTSELLYQGKLLDLSNIPAGYYVLRIESPTYMDAIKFIKAN
jgi:hypothetical protein